MHYLLTFSSFLCIWTTNVFCQESIFKVTPCNSENIHIVDDRLLKEIIGNDLTQGDKNPTYCGGIDSLKSYFSKNPLKDEKAKQLVFRVHIGFLVTCDGKAGNFFVVSKGKGDLETYANQILTIVNKMPQVWQAAIKDNNLVDSYQILSFTVTNGALEKVAYRV